MNEWKHTTERYIAFIDIMGFSNYVYRNSHSVVKKRMIKLQQILDDTENNMKNLMKEFDNVDDAIKTAIFSDSILILSKNNSLDSLDVMLYTCQEFLALTLKAKIPLKGAISYGKITADFDKSLFFGKGLIDAYNLQEQLFMYGLILDEKAEKRIRPHNTYIESYCNHGKVKTKTGLINHYMIDGMGWLKENDKVNKQLPINIMEKFYDDMSGYPRMYVDNTIDFIKAIT